MRVVLFQTISFSLTLLLFTIIQLPHYNASKLLMSAQSLDALLQDYAFQAFTRPRTGIPYNGQVPASLTGIKVSAMRLRSGSFRSRGVHSYKEFHIPTGVIEQPYVERLVLVYQNLANWSSFFYPLPGYTYLTPVLGLLAYNASNLFAKDLPQLGIRATDQSISIQFQNLTPNLPFGSSPKCVFFDLFGSVAFDNVLPGNVCLITQQGHFGIVMEESNTAPSPAPVSSGGSLPTAVGGINNGRGSEHNRKRGRFWLITIWSSIGGVLVLVLLSLFVVRVRGVKHNKRLQNIQWTDEKGEDLQFAVIGRSKAPVAMATRTRPFLEDEYMP